MKLVSRNERSSLGRKQLRMKRKTYTIRLLHMLDKLGMPYVIEASEDCMWNGRYLPVDFDHSNITHEVAHWLQASPEQRMHSSFGLDASNEGQMTDLKVWKLTHAIDKMLLAEVD